jgi:hypothetical protein
MDNKFPKAYKIDTSFKYVSKDATTYEYLRDKFQRIQNQIELQKYKQRMQTEQQR